MLGKAYTAPTNAMDESEVSITPVLTAGADRAARLPLSALVYNAGFTEICKSNTCGFYGTNHSCPPGSGSAKALFDRFTYSGFFILFQKDYPMDGDFDIEGIRRAATAFGALCRDICNEYAKMGYETRVLGAGPCTLCKTCTYPQPCRFSEKIIYPLEAAGIDVGYACEAAGLPYRAKGNVVTYSGAVKVGSMK